MIQIELFTKQKQTHRYQKQTYGLPWGLRWYKNPPAIQETWPRSMGWEDPVEEEMATTPVFLPGESHGQRNLVGCSPWDHRVGPD